MLKREYFFGLQKDDFNGDRHVMTGLIDIFEQPIVRATIPMKKHPVGFGRQEEWNAFDREPISRTDTDAAPGFGKGGVLWEFEPGDFGFSEV